MLRLLRHSPTFFTRLFPLSAGVNWVGTMGENIDETDCERDFSFRIERLLHWEFQEFFWNPAFHPIKDSSPKSFVTRLESFRPYCYSYQGWLNYWTYFPSGNPFMLPRMPVLQKLCAVCLCSDRIAGREAHGKGTIFCLWFRRSDTFIFSMK